MISNQGKFDHPGYCSRHVTDPNLTKYVQERNPGVEGGRVNRPGSREMRRAAERFHRKEAKKNK